MATYVAELNGYRVATYIVEINDDLIENAQAFQTIPGSLQFQVKI